MKLNGLRSVYRRPYRVTTRSDHVKPVAENLLDRRFRQSAMNRAWVADITYVPTGEGWLYLAAILDLASRRIVGWSMSGRMPATPLPKALPLEGEGWEGVSSARGFAQTVEPPPPAPPLRGGE